MPRKLILPVLLLAVVAAGCGGLKKVEGVVTLDGKAVSGATVVFNSSDGKGQPATGFTDASGNFSISSGKKKGLPPGEYKVTVTKLPAAAEPMKPGSAEYKKMAEGAAKGKGSLGGKNELPEQYSKVDTTPFTVKVPLESSPLKLELTSKK